MPGVPMSMRRTIVTLLASVSLPLIGCTGGDHTARPAASPEDITAVLSRSADARPIALNNQDLEIPWAVAGSQEEKCAGTGTRITGSAVAGKGDFTHLGSTTVSTS